MTEEGKEHEELLSRDWCPSWSKGRSQGTKKIQLERQEVVVKEMQGMEIMVGFGLLIMRRSRNHHKAE